MKDFILRPPTYKEYKYLREKLHLGINYHSDFNPYDKNPFGIVNYLRIWLYDTNIMGKSLVVGEVKGEIQKTVADDYHLYCFYPVIPATKELIEDYNNGKKNFCRFPTEKVSNELKKELYEHYKKGDLLFTEHFYGRSPEFYYKGKRYILFFNQRYNYEYDGTSFNDSFKNHINNYFEYFVDHNFSSSNDWLVVEDIPFKYIEKLNIFVSDRVFLYINYNKEFRKSNKYKEMIEDMKNNPETIEFPYSSVNDYKLTGKTGVTTHPNVSTLQSLCYPCVEPTDFAKLYYHDPTNYYYSVFLPFDYQIRVNSKEIIKEDDNRKVIIYGEYPQKVIESGDSLDGMLTGKTYHLLIDNNFACCDEYMDDKKGIKYIMIGEKPYCHYYEVMPVEWEENGSSIISNQYLFNCNSKFNVNRYVVTFFMKDIIPSKTQLDVKKEIDSNIGYQLLMNKNGLSEDDLEFDEKNKLVLKK